MVRPGRSSGSHLNIKFGPQSLATLLHRTVTHTPHRVRAATLDERPWVAFTALPGSLRDEPGAITIIGRDDREG